ncbi:protein-glutamate methylesterase/protein-glutamine glutaminase [Alteromonas oceanisediminis]|uniref:protein-glutamate methylesterase/protein-glutamine glutaminase n=1 Tax=Alteromonas oceanisediminis TaxID=2836180 RepID=UPI001BD9224C|nr:chemotaxis response regulator protein-glutamate methylesterase [Alteromonas oceanisediminis]MBT0584899.1 chemotaxis response regulator protein-glutamate methylesterase [Alteromonas oceanisediminis]
MSFKVLVVDDSSFYRRRVKEILNQDPLLEVVAEASNGEMALSRIASHRPDVVTMDVEMPIMDGITAVRRIMSAHPVPILMFSSLTHDGAKATLEALDAGALDFLPKNFEDIAKNRQEATLVLRNKVRAIAVRKTAQKPTQKFFRSSSVLTGRKPTETDTVVETAPTYASGKRYKLLAIGASTGGPVALQKVLQPIPASYPYPIVIVQHMPGTFTEAFAERLNSLCAIQVKEAQTGDVLKPGHAYVAPGGKQMRVDGTSNNARLTILDTVAGPEQMYKPSVDVTFSSIAKVYMGDVLGIILTGMGADGRDGCSELKQRGSVVWAQDEKSSVVYGMPQAVTVAKIAQRSLPLDSIASSILTEMKG